MKSPVSRYLKTVGILSFLLALLVSCGAVSRPRIVAPLSYAPLPAPPDEPFRSTPPESGPLDVGQTFGLAKTRLANGLEVILVEHHGLPVLSAQLVIGRGARDLAGKRWEMLDLAVTALVREQQSSPGAAPDVRPSAACNADGCVLSVKCLSGSLESAMKVLSDLAVRPRYSAWQESRLRDEWNAWRSSTRNTASGVLDTNARALVFYPGDADAPIPAASANALAGLTMQTLRNVHASLFLPAHATLVVAGDTTLDALSAAAERALGSWSSAKPALPMTAATPPIPSPSARVVLVDYPGELVHAYVVGRAPAANEPALDAVFLLAALLAKPQGRLHDEVRAQLGATYDLDFDMSPGRTGSWFMLGGAFEPSRALPAISAVLAAVRTARDHGVGAADLEGARTRAIAARREASGTAAGAASLVSGTILSGAPLPWVLTRQARIAKLTGDDIRRVAEVWLSEKMLWVVVLGPRDRLAQPFETLGLGPPQWRGRSAEPVAP